MVAAPAHPNPVRLVFLDRATLRSDIDLPRMPFDYELVEYPQTAPGQVIERLQGARIAIVNKVRLGKTELAALPHLELIAVAATGTDNIDLAACTARGIAVLNVAGYASRSVPEHTFALILSLARGLHVYRSQVAAGRWSASGQFCFHTHPITELAGKTLGIIGKGAHGRAVGQIALAFGMKVLFAERKGAISVRREHQSFEDVLAKSDILTLHCPLTPETFHLLADHEFALMARHPILVNVGRGGLVDEHALIRAVDSGAISALGLDVLAVEPPDPANPLLALIDQPTVIITPHIAWASEDAMKSLMAEVAANITRFLACPARISMPPP
ncbi:D-2-hydroxyacid dehydrogenase [Amorphus sp. MBR-141]